jgi:hypothetical protein
LDPLLRLKAQSKCCSKPFSDSFSETVWKNLQARVSRLTISLVIAT